MDALKNSKVVKIIAGIIAVCAAIAVACCIGYFSQEMASSDTEEQAVFGYKEEKTSEKYDSYSQLASQLGVEETSIFSDKDSLGLAPSYSFLEYLQKTKTYIERSDDNDWHKIISLGAVFQNDENTDCNELIAYGNLDCVSKIGLRYPYLIDYIKSDVSALYEVRYRGEFIYVAFYNYTGQMDGGKDSSLLMDGDFAYRIECLFGGDDGRYCIEWGIAANGGEAPTVSKRGLRKT